MNPMLRALASLSIISSSLVADVIAREEFFRPSSCMAIKISPDGKRLAYVGADKEGVMNLYLAPALTLESAEKVTHFQQPEIKGFYWDAKGQNILLLKDTDGTGQFRLYSVNVATKKTVEITEQFGSINAKIFQVSSQEDKAIIGINDRNPMFHDLYLLDTEQSRTTKVYQNDGFINFVFDSALNIAVKVRMNPDSSLSLFDREDKLLFNISAEDAFHTECLHYHELEDALYLIDNRDCNTTQLKKINLRSPGEEQVLGQDPESDIEEVYFENGAPAAYSTYYTHQKWHVCQETLREDLAYLDSQLPNEYYLSSCSLDQRRIIVSSEGKFLLYDQDEKSLKELFSPGCTSYLSPMYPLVTTSRDGFKLVSYLVLPKDLDKGGYVEEPLPLVVVPHGGPFKVRDRYRYCPYHQWLASRGYAVLSVNFRLSSGFGKEFVNAGNGQWGKKAHEDILDVIQYCIKAKIADKDKLAVFGGSYGGYEALASLTFPPDVFACAVAISGPSNLKTVLDSVPFYWEFPVSPLSDKMVYFTKNAFIKSMGGNPDKEDEIPYLHSCFPLNHVDKIQKPLLLVHGANDPIVAAKESAQIFAEMHKKNLPAVYISFPDEGHRIRKFANQMCYLAYSEHFLAQYLGGIYEPLSAQELQASSAIIQSHNMDENGVPLKL